jgi:hypothetical protein
LGESYPRSVSSEGSTGLIKLGKLVKQDGQGRLDFGFEDEHHFFVDLEVGMRRSES